MIDRITVFIAGLLFVSFIGFLGYSIKAIPLSLIMILVVGLMAYDFYTAIKNTPNRNGSQPLSSSSPPPADDATAPAP
ncbi:MAG: hypothetical protein RIB59_05615 [Rhodospirillales bacterium]